MPGSSEGYSGVLRSHTTSSSTGAAPAGTGGSGLAPRPQAMSGFTVSPSSSSAALPCGDSVRGSPGHPGVPAGSCPPAPLPPPLTSSSGSVRVWKPSTGSEGGSGRSPSGSGSSGASMGFPGDPPAGSLVPRHPGMNPPRPLLRVPLSPPRSPAVPPPPPGAGDQDLRDPGESSQVPPRAGKGRDHPSLPQRGSGLRGTRGTGGRETAPVLVPAGLTGAPGTGPGRGRLRCGRRWLWTGGAPPSPLVTEFGGGGTGGSCR